MLPFKPQPKDKTIDPPTPSGNSLSLYDKENNVEDSNEISPIKEYFDSLDDDEKIELCGLVKKYENSNKNKPTGDVDVSDMMGESSKDNENS